jgi:hypothetical protein
MKMRTIWKPNTVFSVSLREGYFCLVQTFETNSKLAVFNLFSNNEKWNDIELKNELVLFYCAIFKNFFQNKSITHRPDLRPCLNLSYPSQMISIGIQARKVILWEGTENQREIVTLGKSPNSICTSTIQGGKQVLEYTEIERSDYDQYRSLEVTTLRAYPEFNERLFLCAKLGKNYDPLKELAFDRTLVPECIDYIDLISGRRPNSELGY